MIYSASKWKKYQTEDLQNTLSLQSEKNEVIFFICPPIWLHFPKVENISSYHLFPLSGKNVKYIFHFLIPIFFIFPKWIIYFTSVVYFQEVENILPMHCISLKFINVSFEFHYCQIVKNVIDRSRNMCK